MNFIETDKIRPVLQASDTEVIRDADIVLFSAGFTHVEESECYDRSWELPFNQGKLIRTVSSINRNTAVILTAGGGVETESWIHCVPALLHTFYLGENAGTAIGEVLFGEVNPSGKLPFSMAKKWDDFASTSHYVKNPSGISVIRILGPQGSSLLRKPWTVEYREKLMVGYRHFDTAGIEPQFPFGFGLSYTEFTYSDFILSSGIITGEDSIHVSVKVTNTGETAGSEIVQLYIKDNESCLIRPEKELKGFEKVYLEPGESRELIFTVEEEQLKYFDHRIGSWIVEPGEFILFIGSSSREIKKTFSIDYKQVTGNLRPIPEL